MNLLSHPFQLGEFGVWSLEFGASAFYFLLYVKYRISYADYKNMEMRMLSMHIFYILYLATNIIDTPYRFYADSLVIRKQEIEMSFSSPDK